MAKKMRNELWLIAFVGAALLLLFTDTVSPVFTEKSDAIQVIIRNPIGVPAAHYQLRWRAPGSGGNERWQWRSREEDAEFGPWTKADLPLLNGDRIQWWWSQE